MPKAKIPRATAARNVPDEYAEFLARKVIAAPPCGFEPVGLPEVLKPFQRDIVTWNCRRGRSATFAGTGLGKTIQELAFLQQVCRHTGGETLLFTPLAVAEQTIQEAVKFDIPGVTYAADPSEIRGPITVTNYDRRERFDLSRFAGVGLDESGIIRDHDSKTRTDLTERCRDIAYLLCASATPAPNDWTELGQHAEFLGVMSAQEMLATFFVHEGAVRANAEDEWRLKRHATADFWRWVASWAVVIRHPRDLGYDDHGYDLPPLHVEQVTVKVPYAPTAGMLFPMAASTMGERIASRRDSIAERVDAAAEIVASRSSESGLIWCGLNAEAEALVTAIPGLVNVQGSDKPEIKSKHLLGFAHGSPLRMVTKTSIGGRGLNWQICRYMIFLGLNDSFEQLYQGIRRGWRFGRVGDMWVYLIASELDGAVVANLKAKERRYEEMAEGMVGHMRELSVAAVRGGRVSTSNYNPQVKMELPGWLS